MSEDKHKKPCHLVTLSPCHLVTFWLAGRLHGIDVADVKEVNPETTFTPVHHAPPAVLGYVNLRGQIYVVLDLRRLLALEPATLGPDSRLVILKPHVGDSLAVLVDRIGDIVAVTADVLEPAQNDEGLLGGVARLENDLLLIVRANQFQATIERAISKKN
jgi:purine-binding chemotaxis protein CheW